MKVCVVTGTRAEYGLFYWLLKRLQQDTFFELQLVATGMHLSPEFGNTYKEIESDGFVINDKVEILLSGDSPSAITKSTGLALIGFAECYKQLKPDLMLLLGDRYEAMAAAQAAMFANIPIAHIHGGEATFGAIDESIRHAISKMSHIHFAATEVYRQRLIQMGEQPDMVHDVGALGVESAKRTSLMSHAQLQESINFKLGEKFFLVTYHPVTQDLQGQRHGIDALLAALDKYSDYKILITFPNADTHGRELINIIKRFAQAQPERVYLTESLGRIRYLSALKLCQCVIGNSSSGIIEAPSYRTPTVNIGSRQQGRVCADSVFHCDNQVEEIQACINKALAVNNREEISIFSNPYEKESSSASIVSILKKAELKKLAKKVFFDKASY